MRKGNIEFRWSKYNQAHELVRWLTDDSCYVVAFFDKSSEGYNMRTVGDRFWDDHDAWLVSQHAMYFLNSCFAEQEAHETTQD